MIAGIAIPTIHAARDRDTTRWPPAFWQIDCTPRATSLKRNACVAIRFDPVDVGRFVVYVDGDGDGVLQSDIEGGIDVALGPESRLSDVFAAAALRILRDIPDPDGSGTLIANSDPIRLGSSNFLSFSPIGSATSGTIYLAGAGGAQAAVRVMGATGRMRVLLFDVGSRRGAKNDGWRRPPFFAARFLEHTSYSPSAILRPGRDVTLVNLSTGGALVRSTGRMNPGVRRAAARRPVASDRLRPHRSMPRHQRQSLKFEAAIVFDASFAGRADSE